MNEYIMDIISHHKKNDDNDNHQHHCMKKKMNGILKTKEIINYYHYFKQWSKIALKRIVPSG